jgi:hypothetical protein
MRRRGHVARGESPGTRTKTYPIPDGAGRSDPAAARSSMSGLAGARPPPAVPTLVTEMSSRWLRPTGSTDQQAPLRNSQKRTRRHAKTTI